ncbi:MAG: TonB-dependent receptor plug domain-containing protein [Steroidobacteraceae bacterium]
MTDKNFKWPRRRVGAALAMLLAISAAAAQEEPRSGPVLETVTVTARRVEEDLQKVPVAVTAFSGAELDNLQVNSVTDLQYHAPSLIVTQGPFGQTAGFFGLRGLYNTTTSTANPSVATYFNEVLVSGLVVARQMFDLQSVQVLTGPQGTLFGSSSTGGAVVMTSQKPTDEYEGSLELGIGEYNRREVTAVVNLPLHEKFQMRIAGKYVDRDGYTEQLNPSCPVEIDSGPGPLPGRQIEPFHCANMRDNGDLDDERYKTVRVSAAAQFTDWLSNDTVFYWYDSEQNGASGRSYKFGGLAAIAFNPAVTALTGLPSTTQVLAEQETYGEREVYTDVGQWYETRQTGVSNVTTMEFSKVKVRNIYGYRRENQSNLTDNDYSRLPVILQHLESREPANIHSEELQFIGSLWDDKIDWIIGGYYSHNKTKNISNDTNGTWLSFGTAAQRQQYVAIGLGCCFFAGPLTDEFPTETKTEQEAFYGNFTLDLSNVLQGLSFSGGYRTTSNDSESRQFRDALPVCNLVPNRVVEVEGNCTRLVEQNSDGSNWSATINYQATEKLFLYFASRHGFKPGGSNDASIQNPAFFEYEPESITDYELGLKADYTLGSVPIRSNFAVYQSDYEDIQRQEFIAQPPPAPPAGAIFNAQKATIRGFETNLTFLLTSDLSAQINYSYLDAKFDKYEVPSLTGTGTVDRSDNKFAGAPKHTVSVDTRYILPFFDKSRYGEFALGVDYFYRSSATYSEGNSIDHGEGSGVQPSYDIANAHLTWVSPQQVLTIMGTVTNLTDELYITGNNDYTDSTIGYARLWYGAPRMWLLSARYDFR